MAVKRGSQVQDTLTPAEVAFLAEEAPGADANAFEHMALELALERRTGGHWLRLEYLIREHGAAFLRRHVARHPGTRPQWWWKTKAPEPHRAIVEGSGDPSEWNAWHGVAENFAEGSRRIVIESEAAYLERHGLLAARERARLTAEAFTPQRWVDPVTATRIEQRRQRTVAQDGGT